ncbi:PilZ domain-containing protein [Sphingomonas natans]|uniref:PilZ domain-containing protein n=1 Tax=Sphingomonas natans TaxID=3063330 RepID=UPI0026E26F33|nr:PilZ domain-containing protein [Sphingomonas sp. BIUV-7]
MPFLAKLDLDAGSDARRSRRFLANRLDGMLVGKDRRFDIIIHNISETGFLAEFSSELRPGDTVRLQLARIGFVDARVVRKRGLGHGCQFLTPVPADIVQETIAASLSFAETASRSEPLTPEEAEKQGYRRRAKRERLGALILLACTLLAVVILAAALIRILTA